MSSSPRPSRSCAGWAQPTEGIPKYKSDAGGPARTGVSDPSADDDRRLRVGQEDARCDRVVDGGQPDVLTARLAVALRPIQHVAVVQPFDLVVDRPALG